MAVQRYETIVKEMGVYFSSNCPVVLSAYAVLLDTKMKKYVAQLKLKNCGSEEINSVSVTVRTFDHFDEFAEEIKGYQYVNVNVESGDEFGTKSLVSLTKKVKIKRLEVTVNKIVFSNGSIWEQENGGLLDNKLEPEELSSVFSKKDIDNYCFLLNSNMKYVPYQKDALWMCSCGEMNYGVDNCYLCGADKVKVFDYINKDYLYSALLDPKYNEGIELKNQRSLESLKRAKKVFEELGNYKDSKEQISVCNQEIDNIQKEIVTKKQEEERQAELQRKEAEEKEKRNKKIVIILAIVAAVCLGGIFISKNVIIPNSKYNAAVELMENGDYEGAIELFEQLDGYKDSAEQIHACHVALITNAEPGDTVFFGSYEQDNNTSNGKEPIEWIVLTKENDSVLVISKDALDCQQYNTSWEEVTWKTCSLRKWLNKAFLEDAFDSEEEAKIVKSTVVASKNPEYDMDPGDDTNDKIFLLSLLEVKKYLRSDEQRKCYSTVYAKEQGAFVDKSTECCCWWLRTPGSTSDLVVYVDSDGSVDIEGRLVDDTFGGCVRPALWINLDS